MNRSAYIQYDLSKMTNSSNTMEIPYGYFNGDDITTFNISNNGNLNRIVIGQNSFFNVKVFSMIGLIG